MSDLPISSRPISRPSLFDSYTQILEGIDPSQLRPIHDRLLIRDAPDEEYSRGGISLVAAPSMGGLGKSGRIRIGEVVARGDGDPYYTYVSGGKVRGKAWMCPSCRGGGATSWPHGFPMLCHTCGESGIGPRPPMLCQVGNRVVFDRRREGEIFLNRERYVLLHEYQALYGKIVDNLFTPAYDRILLEPVVQSGQKDSLIAAPDNAKPGQFREGIVRSVGCGTRHADGKCYPPQVKPGDRVLFTAHYAPTESHHIAEEITLFGEELLIMREKQILAVVG